MSEETGHLQLEALLSDALRPIEPPEDLVSRVESTLTAITEQAAAELSSWAEELSEGSGHRGERAQDGQARLSARLAAGAPEGPGWLRRGQYVRERPPGLQRPPRDR